MNVRGMALAGLLVALVGLGGSSALARSSPGHEIEKQGVLRFEGREYRISVTLTTPGSAGLLFLPVIPVDGSNAGVVAMVTVQQINQNGPMWTLPAPVMTLTDGRRLERHAQMVRTGNPLRILTPFGTQYFGGAIPGATFETLSSPRVTLTFSSRRDRATVVVEAPEIRSYFPPPFEPLPGFVP